MQLCCILEDCGPHGMFSVGDPRSTSMEISRPYNVLLKWTCQCTQVVLFLSNSFLSIQHWTNVVFRDKSMASTAYYYTGSTRLLTTQEQNGSLTKGDFLYDWLHVLAPLVAVYLSGCNFLVAVPIRICRNAQKSKNECCWTLAAPFLFAVI